jgi:transforming growth factor-beta-induced protein
MLTSIASVRLRTLLPLAALLSGAMAFQGANAYEAKAKAKASADIVDTAVAAGSFNTLATALKAAGLVETLKGPGPFTVFAPTDEAFAKLPAGTLESLLKPENKAKLAGILTYHVVAGKVMAADVVKLTSAKTVNGQPVKIAVEGGKVKVEGANVVKTDIGASNGVIHVIDAVLLPK